MADTFDIRDEVLLARELRQSAGWRDLTSTIIAAKLPAANAPTLQAFNPGGTGLRQEYAFAVNDYVLLPAFHVNHDILPGISQAYGHVHWSTDGVDVQPVKWELQIHRARGHNQANFGAVASLFVTQAAHGSAWRHMITEVIDLDALTLTEPDELILVTLRRVTNGAVDNADRVFGLTVDFHYQADRWCTPAKAPDFYPLP